MSVEQLSALGLAASKAIAARGGQVRILGGIGVELAAGPRPPTLARTIEDVDLICRRTDRGAAEDALAGIGLSADREVNALHGAQRQVWWGEGRGVHLDLFLGEFAMCHKLDLERRLDGPGPALGIEDLLLTKLQIVELTDKDVRDLGMLLGGEALGGERVAEACAEDWGLATTVSDNLVGIGSAVGDLDPLLGERVARQAAVLLAAVDSAPKGRRWRMRARVGRKVRWYALPDEVIEDE